MTNETAKILADALTRLNKNIGSFADMTLNSIHSLADLTLGIGEHVKVQTENTELLLRAVTAKGVEEAADIAKSLPLKKRQKMYDEIVAKLRDELKLDEKPAEPVVETPPTHDE